MSAENKYHRGSMFGMANIFDKALALAGEQKGKELLKKSLRLAKETNGCVVYAVAVGEYEKFIKSISCYKVEIQAVLIEALLFAIECHDGQFYQWKEKTALPYTFHCAKAAINVQVFQQTPEAIISALWHDLLEDKRATREIVLLRLITYKNLCCQPEEILSVLGLLDRHSYTGKTKVHDYYNGLSSNQLALIVKAADLLTNLEACSLRFDEMRQDKSRFWIYAYIFEIEKCLFTNPAFQRSPFAQLVTRHLSSALNDVRAHFGQDGQKECANYQEARKNETPGKS